MNVQSRGPLTTLFTRATILALVVLLSACAGGKGVEKHAPGQEPVLLTAETEQELPKGNATYRIAPMDTLQVDVYPKRGVNVRRKVEYANEIKLEFFFKDKVYRISRGDELGIELAGESDKVYDVAVLPNGEMNLPRIGRTVTAVGLTTAELVAVLNREYSSLLRNPRVTISVQKSGLEQLQRLSGIYTADNDGNIVVPLLGNFKILGLNAGQAAAGLEEKAREYFHNKVDVVASILPVSSRQPDSRLSPDGQQYFRNTIKVGPDGTIFIPDAGIFTAAEKTITALNQEIQQTFSQIYQNEVQVRVGLHESPNQSVFVGGEVRTPGKYPYYGSLTLLQLISTAGWVNDNADLSEVVLLHAEEGNRYVVYRTNLTEVSDGTARLKQDLKLSPRDIVIVPKSGIAKLDLWVDQYIRRVLPFGTSVNYTFSNQQNVPDPR